LDDGFQHRALARDADLVLLTDDAAAAWPLPAGPPREPVRSLGRAPALPALRDGRPSLAPAEPALFRRRLRPAAPLRAPGGARVEESLPDLVGRPVVAVAGVAHPERLAATLAGLGADVRGLLAFPDHHAYGADDVARIAAAGAEGLLVTTEKDLAKLGGLPG